MKASAITASLLTFISGTFARPLNDSGPFYLILDTPENPDTHMVRLYACHIGAATESLCPTKPNDQEAFRYQLFTFRPSNNKTDQPGNPGLLLFTDPAVLAGRPPLEGKMDLENSGYGDDVKIPKFFPGGGHEVFFDPHQNLAVFGKKGDTNWWLCTTHYLGNAKVTVGWKEGDDSVPNNESCKQISIKRVGI